MEIGLKIDLSKNLKADIIDFKAKQAKAFYALKAKYIAQCKQGSN